MAPVAVGENAELPTLDEGPDALLRVGEVSGARLRVARDRLRQRRRRRGVRFQRRNDIDPVERMQVVEVHHVIVHVLRADHQVADQVGVIGNVVVQRILDRAHRRNAMYERANAADALREGPRLARIAPAQDDLDPAHHRAGGIRRLDRAGLVDFGLDAQMPFDPGDGIDHDALVHASGPFQSTRLSATSSSRLSTFLSHLKCLAPCVSVIRHWPHAVTKRSALASSTSRCFS